MARLAAEDPWAGLAPADRLPGAATRTSTSSTPPKWSAEDLEARARAAEDAARETPGVTNSEGGSASWSASTWRLITSDGFAGQHRASAFSLSAQAIAGEGSGMEQAGEGRATRWAEDLPTPAAIGAEAGRRAVASLNARKIASATAPVVFENRLAASLLGPLIGAISGPSVARGVSFLKDRLGATLFAKGCHPDRTIPTALAASAPHPSMTKAWPIGAWTSSMTAFSPPGCSTLVRGRQLGLETTGHASRGLAGPPGVGPV